MVRGRLNVLYQEKAIKVFASLHFQNATPPLPSPCVCVCMYEVPNWIFHEAKEEKNLKKEVGLQKVGQLNSIESREKLNILLTKSALWPNKLFGGGSGMAYLVYVWPVHAPRPRKPHLYFFFLTAYFSCKCPTQLDFLATKGKLKECCTNNKTITKIMQLYVAFPRLEKYA